MRERILCFAMRMWDIDAEGRGVGGVGRSEGVGIRLTMVRIDVEGWMLEVQERLPRKIVAKSQRLPLTKACPVEVWSRYANSAVKSRDGAWNSPACVARCPVVCCESTCWRAARWRDWDTPRRTQSRRRRWSRWHTGDPPRRATPGEQSEIRNRIAPGPGQSQRS